LVRRDRARRSRASDISDPARPVPPPSSSETLIELTCAVRAALAARFGEHWQAKTTEEVAADPALVAAFDAPTVELLVALLRRSDLVKFAGTSSLVNEVDSTEVDQWARWVDGFASRAGARSTINGK
jgi:hypothetical protein